MRKKILVPVAGVLILLLAAGIFPAIKKYYARRELTRLYMEGLKPVYDKENPFCLEARLVYLDSLLKIHAYGYSELDAKLLKATTLLKLGREKDAIDLLSELLVTLKPVAGKPDEIRTKSLLALAYIRLGERNNCINNHSSESCIMPVREKGVYIDAGSTRRAITLYEEILARDSGDLDSRWLLNIAYMTIGEYPDRVPVQWLIPGLDTTGTDTLVIPFKDIASELQLSGLKNMAGGSLVDEFDNDGYLDIVTSC